MERRDGAYWNAPAGVEVTMRDGSRTLLMFSTRLEAEEWVFLLPLMQLWGYEGVGEIAAAMLAEVSGLGLN